MKTPVTILTAAALALVAACSKAPEPGAAEKAGQKIDQALVRAGERAQEALKKAEAATNQRLEEAGQAMERAGVRLKERESRE